jgi:hypothetical protein
MAAGFMETKVTTAPFVALPGMLNDIEMRLRIMFAILSNGNSEISSNLFELTESFPSYQIEALKSDLLHLAVSLCLLQF